MSSFQIWVHGSIMAAALVCAVALAEEGERFTVAPGAMVPGHNIFAPDCLCGPEGWRCYYGGWQEAGQTNDQVYLVTARTLSGPWSPPRLLVAHGTWQMVNDPTVARGPEGGWHMLYTMGNVIPEPFAFDEWIGYSTSEDGLTWTPDAGGEANRIRIEDPDGVAKGTLTGAARPSLVWDGKAWRLWFDGDVDHRHAPQSFLAVGTGPRPDHFRLVQAYPPLETGFASFWEPDVAFAGEGRFVAVCQRHFTELWLGESTDGVHFTFRRALTVAQADYPRARVSNPALLLSGDGTVAGLSFGMCGPSLMDHDIGFAFSPDGERTQTEVPQRPEGE